MVGIFQVGPCGEQVLKSYVERCCIALFVDSNPDGTFFTDTGWWPNIAQRGKYVVDTCLVARRVGGGSTNAGKEALCPLEAE